MSLLGLDAGQIVLITLTSLLAQVVGGLAGYGGGLLLPIVLVPIIGAEAVLPVISLAAILTNATRIAVFKEYVDVYKALIIAAFAIPSTMLGAYFYTRLSGPSAAIVIGAALVALVPTRRYLKRLSFTLKGPGVGVAGIVYGFLTGSISGAGVLLISMLMAMGLTGLQVIATDALTSTILGVVKSGVFFAAGELPPKLWLIAGIIGVMATPGTLIARWMAQRFSARLHETLIEAAIVVGGSTLVWRGLYPPT